MTRSRRAGLSRDEARRQPLYARMLGLQYLAPSGFLCFVFLEGAVALGILLALAELVSWWGVLALPVTVAVMVKLNDVVAGALTRASAAAGASRVSGRSLSVEGAGGLYAAGGVVPGSLGEMGDDPAPVAFTTTRPGSEPERPSRGARTVRLPQSVIAQAARAAGHDRATRGRRSADDHPVAPEPERSTVEQGLEAFRAEQPSAAPQVKAQPGGFQPDGAVFGPQAEAPDLSSPVTAPGGSSTAHWSPVAREPWILDRPRTSAETRGHGTPVDPTEQWASDDRGAHSTPADRDQWAPADGSRWTPRDTDHAPPVPDPSTFPDDPAALNSPRPTWAGQLDDQQQRARQSAARRYQ